VEMPLPLKPRRIEARTEGWTVEGLREDGLADDNLEIVRVGERTPSAGDGLQPAALPPFVLVERSLSLGLSPQADTRVVRVTPPGAVPGPTLTVDQAVLETRPGLRARDTTFTLEIRTSRGGQHALTLPENAELQSVSINGTIRPIPQEKRVVTLPLVPGTQT